MMKKWVNVMNKSSEREMAWKIKSGDMIAGVLMKPESYFDFIERTHEERSPTDGEFEYFEELYDPARHVCTNFSGVVEFVVHSRDGRAICVYYTDCDGDYDVVSIDDIDYWTKCVE